MQEQALKFLLVPNASAARRVRRLIVAQGACSGVVIGTWSELLEWARNAYLLPGPSGDWEELLSAALSKIEGAFWSESLSVAPVETTKVVASAWAQLYSASNPTRGIDGPGLGDLPERPRRHVADLIRLTKSLAGRLPDDLALIQNLLSSTAGDAFQTIEVYCVKEAPLLSRWQSALVAKLNRDAGAATQDGAPDDKFVSILKRVLGDVSEPDDDSALGVLKSRLFTDQDSKVELDSSVQWVGVRDYLQEAEVAAGMVQTLLAQDPELEPANIGLLIPDSFEYSVAVQDAFHLAGLALSGLPTEHWRRDLGREAIFYFLYCRQKPAPAMALAACLSSPLMPWSREDGAVLAQSVMDGNYKLRTPASAGKPARVVLDLLRDGDSEPQTLAQALRKFAAQLAANEAFAGHLPQAGMVVEQICAALENATEIDWASLRRGVNPSFITSGEPPDFNLEGITLWRESQEPWRPVSRLIVLGFSQGHYPLALGTSAVFSAGDILAIGKYMGLPLSTPGQELARRRLGFKRQLRAVAGSVTFLISRRDKSGATQAPSESLMFMQRLFSGPTSAEELIMDLDATGEREQVRHLALAEPESPSAPRALISDDLHFERDLLSLRSDAEGRQKPESPSSLETLMVSRLAWLLRRLHAEPLQWAPESANVMLLGTLAHEVFEGLFRPGEKLPSRDDIANRTDILLGEAITRLAPFLRGSQWQVERRNLAMGTAKAARDWHDVLAQLDAEVLASEQWLQGTWSGIPIHGQADLIVGLSGDRLLVVDYKRSKSKNRRARMEKGYDSQANLYRAMLQSGGLKDGDNAALALRLNSASRTGIVYYMLNDQVSLADSRLPEAEAIPGWEALENDVSGSAMALIGQRISEVRQGHLCLNRDSDAAFFDKQAGVKPYALENSPLIALFTLPDDAEIAQ